MSTNNIRKQIKVRFIIFHLALLICLGYTNILFSQGVSISATGGAPNASSGLDIDFSDRGLLIPRMTTAERDAIGSPGHSLMIYNTTTDCLELYNANTLQWVSGFCIGCQLPGAFLATSGTTIGSESFDANWGISAGVSTYYLDVDDNSDFSSPLVGYDNLNVGNVNTYSITGLTASTTYYYRIRANNSCGTSVNSNAITVTTLDPPTYPAGSVHCISGGATIQDVTNPTTGDTWMDRNLGASQIATASTDASAYGDVYQWGRLSDGHQCRTSSSIFTTSSMDDPGDNRYFKNTGNPYDWRVPQNDNLWQGVGGTNNPCPSGYRLPTQSEFDSERMSWNTNDIAGAFASPLKLTAAGYREESNGAFYSGFGLYWTSSVNGIYGWNLYFATPSVTNMTIRERGSALSVRCIKD